MSDLALDLETHDLALTATGELYLTADIPTSAAQRIAITLLMFSGEWFLDLTAGVPYYQSILVKNPDLALVRSLFRAKVAADGFAVDVPRMDVTLDRATRRLTISFSARLRSGDELEVLISEDVVSGALVINGIQVTINGVPVTING